MSLTVEVVVRALVMGIAAAALMDLWGLLVRRGLGVPTLDYAMLGRWIGHMPRGQFTHERIAAASPVRSERVLGWVAHYSIGVVFAIALLLVVEPGWADAPSIGPALVIGLGTIVAPWLLMQPGMGAGIAASRTPNPTATRLRNLATHTVYGLGLYMAAVVLAILRM